MTPVPPNSIGPTAPTLPPADYRIAKCGNWPARKKESARRTRDARNYQYIREIRNARIDKLIRSGYERPNATVYLMYGEEPFRVTHQYDGKRMPPWRDLTPWMKVQLLTMLLNDREEGFLTFTINVPDYYENKWIDKGQNPSAMMRDRISKELTKHVGKNLKFFFVMEGHNKTEKTRTFLHLQGGVIIPKSSDLPAIKQALRRAAGYDLRSPKAKERGAAFKTYYHQGIALTDYIFKMFDLIDDRLAGNKVVISNSGTQAARKLWNDITGRS